MSGLRPQGWIRIVAVHTRTVVVALLLNRTSHLPSPRMQLSTNQPIYLELWMIGVIISAMVYGGVLSLSFSYVPLLLKTSHDISRRMRNFLLVYVAFMVTISTVYIITMIIALTRSIFYASANPFVPSAFGYFFQNVLVGALCITFANWGADWFMVSKVQEI